MGFIKVLLDVVTGKGFGKLFQGKGALGGDYVDRQLFQHTGFTSLPRNGSQAVVLKRGENYICIASADNPENVPDLQNAGDVAIYTTSDYLIKISASGQIEIKGNGNPGSIILGSGVVDKIMKDSIIDKYNNHVHPSNGLPIAPGDPTRFNSSDATTETEAS